MVKAKVFLVAMAVVVAGIFYSNGQTVKNIMIAGALCSIVFMFIINKNVKSRTTELFISGFALVIIEAYHFYIQPNVVLLPELPSTFQLFIGTFIVTRALLYIGETVESPVQSTVKKVMHNG